MMYVERILLVIMLEESKLTNKILSHRTQLSFYEKAIKKIYGISIKDTYIVFLDIGKAFKIFKQE